VNPFCVLLWIMVLDCNPVAQNYLEAASAVSTQPLALRTRERDGVHSL
jgi:hypothetical protein